MNGLRWTAPGEGATIAELAAVMPGKHILAPDQCNLKTDLILTGNPITFYDCFRIDEAMRAAGAALRRAERSRSTQ